MPVMYKELGDRYKITKANTGITGVRVFVRDDANGDILAANLPDGIDTDAIIDVDDQTTDPPTAGSSLATCLLRSIEIVYHQGRNNAPLYVCNYSTTPANDDGGRGVSTDSDSRSFSAGGEFEVFEPSAASPWAWTTAAAPVEQPVRKRTITGTFSLPYPLLTNTQKTNLFDNFKDAAGSINNAAFEGFAEGQVLLTGMDGGTVYDAAGNLRWSFNLNFAFRILKGAQAAIVADDWLYVYNRESGKYDKPFIDDTPDIYLYAKTAFPADWSV